MRQLLELRHHLLINISLLDHLAPEVEVVATGLRGEVTDHVLVDARDINHREARQLTLYGFFEVGRQLHLQGLAASHQGEGARKVLNDQVGGIQDFMVVRVESEVFQDELSRGDKGDSH